MAWWLWAIIGVVANWAIPAVLSWSYAMWAYFVGDFVHAGYYGPFIKFRLATKMSSLHSRLWKRWSGLGLLGFLIYRDYADDHFETSRRVRHEGTHCWHWLMLGLLFIVAYVGHMGFIYLFQKDKHPYYDCWSERLARKKAGQIVNLPRRWWPDGPKDRWPWW